MNDTSPARATVDTLGNRTFDEIAISDTAVVGRTLAADGIRAFAPALAEVKLTIQSSA